MLSAMRLAVFNGAMMLRMTQRPWIKSSTRLAINTTPSAMLALRMADSVPALVCSVLDSINSLNAAICSSS
ncbi:hypothetical protein D3C81_1951530 [compost metagenome]